MAANRVAGVCFLKVDGVQYSLRGSFKVQGIMTQKSGVAGLDGVHGYKEVPVVPSIDGEITDSPTLSIAAFQNITDSTVTAEMATGKTYILQNAWYAGTAELEGDEGKITVKFEGMKIIEDMTA